MKPSAILVVLCTSLCFSISTLFAANLDIPDSGFEQSPSLWKVASDDKDMSQIVPEAAFSGKMGLRIEDASSESGSSIFSPRMPAKSSCVYQLTFKGRLVSGGGVGVYLRFLDSKGKQVNPSPEFKDVVSLGNNSKKEWTSYSLQAVAPESATEVEIWIHSYKSDQVVADFDDFALSEIEQKNEPPWPSTYKISPNEKSKLTEADVVGPDGIVYPDWSMCGVPGGIPNITKTAVGPDFFKGYENKDISQRIAEALNQAASKGGGVVQLPEGTFFLDTAVLIRKDSLVLRGAGVEKTKLIYRERIPFGEIRFYNWDETGTTIHAGGSFAFTANPKNLITFVASSNGKELVNKTRKDHWGNRFSIPLNGTQILKDLGPGKQIIQVVAEYSTGEKFTKSFEITLDPSPIEGTYDGQYSALSIVGRQPSTTKILLTKDGLRGSRSIVLQDKHELKPGDKIEITAPATKRWNDLTNNKCLWGTYRSNQYEVKNVNGNTITINQPLRLDFPVIDESFVIKIFPIQNSGIENLTIEQDVITKKKEGSIIKETIWYPIEDLWANGIAVNFAWGCWTKDVRILNSGRNPLYFLSSKFCEARNVECIGAIFKGGGGTGYVGIERSYDCLMESLTTHGMRHAPDIQWGASGNVIRASEFHGSDGQWHAGWTNENLFENNLIDLNDAIPNLTIDDPRKGSGNYGNGLYGTSPTDAAHGPQGPRNVIYGNDITSFKDCLHMGGGNEAWIVVYNRFRTINGYAVYGGEKTFDHMIKGNVFAIKDPKKPAIVFEKAECVGSDIVENSFYGSITEIAGLRVGKGKFGEIKDNNIYPWTDNPPKPTPPVDSIFLWQKNKAKK